MTQHTTSGKNRTTRTSRAILMASAFTLGGISAETTQELDELIVSALRMPGEASKITSAVTALDPRDLESRGVLDLVQALNEAPGINATSTAGQTGAIGSVFIRGTTTASSQLIVDGMRLSDSNAQLGNFFSGARLDDIGKIEVLRGAQSAIHGGDAIGGVIWLETASGQGDPRTRIRTEAGSFDSLNGYVSHSGQEKSSSWFVGGGYDGTHNDAVGQNFDQARAALRYEWAQAESLTLGMTFRATDGRFENKQDLNHTDSTLATIYADARFAPDWLARFTLGRYQESYDFEQPGFISGTDLDRTVLSTNQSIQINPYHRLLSGAFIEQTDFYAANNFSNPTTDSDELRYGGNLGWEWSPLVSLVTEAVVRWEDYADYGDEVTWRVGTSWQALEKTRFRSGIGKAFGAPTFLDIVGNLQNPLTANPNIQAEESIGWDFGVEQNWGENHMVSLTWFENTIENSINRPFGAKAVNLHGDTETRGLEFAANGAIGDNVSYRAAWTWLGASLRDQPDITATASIDWRPTDKVLVGAGANYVDERSFGGDPMDDYFLLRLYASYQVGQNITLHARMENLGDASYQLGNFFGDVVEGAGLGFFTGITAEF